MIAVTASDESGNTATDTLIVTLADRTPPKITITTPTKNSSYKTNIATINISGTASDNIGVDVVTWRNALTGGSGTCDGTTNWNATIPLTVGKNKLTVTASDASGNGRTDMLNVTCAL